MTGMRRQQRGIVAVVVAVGLLALLAMAGLAIDTGHLVLNKSRLQSTVDASALAAAKVLDQTGSEDQASAAARSVFDLNATDHSELRQVLSGADLTIEYSNTLNPFAAGTTPAKYVRVRADDFSMWTSFTALVGFDELTTAASAVSGPGPPLASAAAGGEVCDLVPMIVCADMNDPPVDPSDSNPPSYWGYRTDDVTLLKLASGMSGDTVGPGNFQLIELGDSGANVLRQNLAGRAEACVDIDGSVTTKPGNNAGPTAQGLNTRFGEYQGGGINSSDYPPDKFTTESSPGLTVNNDDEITLSDGTPFTDFASQVTYSYADYMSDAKNPANASRPGKFRRRVMALPIVDCRTMVNGHGTLPVVDIGCFFLLQRVVQKGNMNYVFGEYIGSCAADGSPGNVPAPPGAAPSGYKIVLHNDPDNDAS